mmetsp:Transcript_6244/g.14066  ORF Transcript_6244/g.14066 Transcript_6244/m.14066 type:complete len:273 (+) Transcript_6244:659-1477(+)
MHFPFYKYQGTGNDFVIFDNRKGVLPSYSVPFIQKICDRRFGIGADGFIIISHHPSYDFEMIYHNADGSQSFCANGSRCAVHLAHHLGIITQEAYFLSSDVPLRAYIEADDIHLQLNDVAEIHTVQEGYLLNTGALHYVRHVDDWATWDVCQAGHAVRNRPLFKKEGVNVNFVHLEENNTLFVRTYERGVEDETLSCGTGVVAAALVAGSTGYKSPITVHTKGGTLRVSFKQKRKCHFQEIRLLGPAKMVFHGKIDMNRELVTGQLQRIANA